MTDQHIILTGLVALLAMVIVWALSLGLVPLPMAVFALLWLGVAFVQWLWLEFMS